MTVALAPDDLVRTHAEAERNSRQPLLVLEPLLEFLHANGLDAPSRSETGTRTSRSACLPA